MSVQWCSRVSVLPVWHSGLIKQTLRFPDAPARAIDSSLSSQPWFARMEKTAVNTVVCECHSLPVSVCVCLCMSFVCVCLCMSFVCVCLCMSFVCVYLCMSFVCV